MTCAEWAALKAQTQADLARAQVDRDAAALDSQAAQVASDAASIAMMNAMNDLATKNIVLSQKEGEVSSKSAMLMYIDMMMSMQGCT